MFQTNLLIDGELVAGEGAEAAFSIAELVEKLAKPRIAWIMVPAGAPVDSTIALLQPLLARGDMKEALVFTRTKHRANRLAEHLIRAGVNADRIHGNRSQAQELE